MVPPSKTSTISPVLRRAFVVILTQPVAIGLRVMVCPLPSNIPVRVTMPCVPTMGYQPLSAVISAVK